MTNAEKYKDDIIAQLCKTGRWAVNKANEIMNCDVCSECIFKDGGYCPDERKSWLNAEKKVFSEKDKALIRVADKVNWVARDKSGIVYGYLTKPHKGGACWYTVGLLNCNLTLTSTAEFTAVKWEDDEPTSREEILGDEK